MTRKGIDDDERLRAARELALELDNEVQSRALALLALIERELRRPNPSPSRLRRLSTRVEALLGDVEFAVDETTKSALEWAALGMAGVVLAGAGLSSPTFSTRLTADRHLRSFTASLRRAAELTDASTARSLRALSAALRAAQAVGPEGAQRLRRQARRSLLNGVARVQYSNGSMFPFGNYVEMLLDTRTTMAYNDAALGAMRRQGTQVVQIVDGIGCGLTSHRDPIKADGLLVSITTAEANPIAHPRCVREFIGRPDLTLAAIR